MNPKMPRWMSALVLGLWSVSLVAHPGGLDEKGCHRDSADNKVHCHEQVVERTTPPRAGGEGVFYGPFVSAGDGDSLRVRIQGVVMEFRLAGIDAPEMDQPYGKRARDELLALVRDKTLVIVFQDVDRYGRIVGEVWVDGRNVNRELVARGAAWFYSQFAMSEVLFRVEEEARSSKRGLWALRASDRIEPWVWRDRKRAKAAQR